MKRTHFTGQPDRLGPDGKWMKFWSDSQVSMILYQSRSYGVWRNISSRCDPASAFRMRSDKYDGCENAFRDYQELAEWCQSQYGYMRREQNGHYWHIDKDLYSPGCNLYSPNTCLFVPARVNKLFHSQVEPGSDLPIGVSIIKKTGRYRAVIRRHGKYKHLGSFRVAVEAHSAWQHEKIIAIQDFIDDPELSGHHGLVNILRSYQDLISADIARSRITNFRCTQQQSKD